MKTAILFKQILNGIKDNENKFGSMYLNQFIILKNYFIHNLHKGIVCPSRKTQKGNVAKAIMVEMKVMATDKSRSPSNAYVQIFDPPPPGEHPVRNRPNQYSGLV